MNRIEPVKLFATPKDHNHILDLIEQIPDKHRASAMIIAMQTWNLACKLANEDEEKSEETGP